MQFDSASAKERATFVPENYAPSVTSFNDVNSHSNVKLSWDGEDKRRENELVKGRSSKKNEKGEEKEDELAGLLDVDLNDTGF